MATPRLPFLYPNLSRAVRTCRPTTYPSLRTLQNPRQCRKAKLHTSRRHAQNAIQQRYGQAVSQALPPPEKPSEPLLPKQEPEQKAPTESKESEDVKSSIDEDQTKEAKIVDEMDTSNDSQSTEAIDGLAKEEQEPLGTKELDLVLSVPSPSELKGEAQRHPHLEASPYVHHFDTYSLVQQLGAKNAYSPEQAVTLMKAIRQMLANNLDVAKEGLVSKSDNENETYLFRAACSELRTTLQTTRHSEVMKQRSQRAQLQHESDILNQKLSQDLMSMREELKGLFNDRKMGLEEEKRRIDSKISELNYEITVLLNSEAKSRVEGLRWVLTRRAALAIGCAAFMIIMALNYSSIKMREREEAEKKKKAARKAEQERAEARYTVPSRAQGTQTDSSTPARDYEESLG